MMHWNKILTEILSFIRNKRRLEHLYGLDEL